MSLTSSIDTLERLRNLVVIPVAAGVKIHQGALVAINPAGYAVPGGVANNLKAAGRAEESVDNTEGTAGKKKITVKRGVFRYLNAFEDKVTRAELFSDCFIYDDGTVAKTNPGGNTRSRAGKVLGVEDMAVWVEIY